MTVANASKKQTDKIVNYQGATNAYIGAAALLQAYGLPELIDRIPFPSDQTTINIIQQPEIRETTTETPITEVTGKTLEPQAQKANGKNLVKAGLIGAALVGLPGLGIAAAPLISSAVDVMYSGKEQSQQNSLPEAPKAKQINPNLSFEVQ
jgi:hypothetical protein